MEKDVTPHNVLVDNAVLNTKYFEFKGLYLKGCRSCNKLIKHNHSDEPRFMKDGRYVYICECTECKKPLLLDSVDFMLLNGKV